MTTLPPDAMPRSTTPPSNDVAGAGRRRPASDAFTCLALAARLHGIAADPQALAHGAGLGASDAVGTRELLLAARRLRLRARAIHSNRSRLASTPLPALATLRLADGSIQRVVLAQCDGARVLYLDPAVDANARPTLESLDGFAQRWTGELILLARSVDTSPTSSGPFGLHWFAPAIHKHRRLLAEVLLVSLTLQLLGLLSPLLFQVVMDKVLVHQTVATLNVLVTGMLVVILFEAAMGCLRSYVLSHTGHRIDVELGADLVRHLLSLPLAYFHARRVGDSVARVRELETIRHFLTGQTLTVMLDLIFSVVFVAVMLSYSVSLTLVVLASLPLYAGLSLIATPLLRARLEQLFARGADSQALLVEAITCIETVKAGALEPVLARRWDEHLAAHMRASFGARNLAAWAQEGIALIGKLTQAALLAWGCREVMGGALSVGEFVAFNLFAQRVSQPVMRLAQFWTDLQQTGISIARLGDILNTRPEPGPSQGDALASIRGHVRFEQVSCRYRPQDAPVLQGVSFDIRAGEVIGIVGRSGCGKSTLARLLQRLIVPDQGRILIDGVDIALADPGRLRQQVSVVLQDNRLFHRSVRENIAITDPAAPLSAIMTAARLSGADDFVQRLPEGYDTVVGEHGTALSGGQRQRIAIARAVFANPRILILDEATSALDYESEAVLQSNMLHIAKGRTVFVIAHRLSSVRRADRIIVMDQGRIVQSGPHDALMKEANGLYARLWALQADDAIGGNGTHEVSTRQPGARS